MRWFRKWWGQDDADFNEYLGLPHQHPHWSARQVRACFGFCKREWKWVIGFALAVVGLIVKIG